jgi:murein L,D-transpeptidase YcbB/YkuD
MSGTKIPISLLLFVVILLIYSSCKERSSPSQEIVIANSPEEFQIKSTDLIKDYLDEIEKNNGKIGDSITLSMHDVVRTIYQNNSLKTAWSENEHWHPYADSLFDLIHHAKGYGLFPEDYHYAQISSIRKRFFNDSLIKGDRRDVALWTKADIMFTDAFVHIIKDIKLGRLPQDSVTLRSDSVLDHDFYWQQFYVLQKRGSLEKIIERHEPKHTGYKQLKEGVKKFLEKSEDKEYTIVPTVKDPQFKTLLQRRLIEAGYLETDSVKADSVKLVSAIKQFQKDAGINADGRVGDVTLRMMNTTVKERFVRIAITMDRYKLLLEKMPDRYLLVNLPGYDLKLMDGDSVTLSSKIICGKPHTRSPVLNSFISELITYPQWTIPLSIIEKEIFPGAKKNPSYITKKGFSLLDSKGNVINPD